MKRSLILLLTLLIVAPVTLQAQENTTTTIQSLAVDLWPDYDRESVLVLITGTLPANADLPVTLTIPLPPDVSLNAVARISTENAMIDDIQYSETADSVTLTTPDTRFRVEYYMPYDANENDRSFTFFWLADVNVEQIKVSVQQPAAAASIEILPAAATRAVGNIDNLTYHVLPQTVVAAQEPYEVNVSYTMTAPQLSVNVASQQQPAPQPAVSPPQTVTNDGLNNNLPLILGIVGGVLIVAVLVWALVNNQKTTPRPRKPQPRKTAVKTRTPKTQPASAQSAKFCHECGAGLQAGDKFCRECGTAVKNPA